LAATGDSGDSSNTPRTYPVQVSGLSDIVAIAAGQKHSMAVTSTGALYLWGFNNSGQLGTGCLIHRNVGRCLR
jgi:alpha-tubulin suppressor-like RCC1 family protein